MAAGVGEGVRQCGVGRAEGFAIVDYPHKAVGMRGGGGQDDRHGVGVVDVALEGGHGLRTAPAVKLLIHYRIDGMADGRRNVGGHLRGLEGYASRVTMEEECVEGARGRIGARYRGVAAVGLVELDSGAPGAQIAPHATHGAQRGVVGLGHVGVALAEHAVHALVGAQHGEIGGVALVAVLAPPRHVEHRLGTRRMAVDGVDQPLGVGEHLAFDLLLRERRILALLLQHDELPAALSDELHRVVAAMLAEGAAAGGVALAGELVAHRPGNLRHHPRQVVDLGVAVAHEKDIDGRLSMAESAGKQEEKQQAGLRNPAAVTREDYVGRLGLECWSFHNH